MGGGAEGKGQKAKFHKITVSHPSINVVTVAYFWRTKIRGKGAEENTEKSFAILTNLVTNFRNLFLKLEFLFCPPPSSSYCYSPELFLLYYLGFISL